MAETPKRDTWNDYQWKVSVEIENRDGASTACLSGKADQGVDELIPLIAAMANLVTLFEMHLGIPPDIEADAQTFKLFLQHREVEV